MERRAEDGKFTHCEHGERHEVQLRLLFLGLHPTAHGPDGDVIVVDWAVHV